MPAPEINVGVRLPGEALVVALIDAWRESRANMSQANRDRLDSLVITSLEEGNKTWMRFLQPMLTALEKLGGDK